MSKGKIQLLDNKDNLKPLSFNPFSSGTTYEIEGPSHKNNGVPMIVNGQEIEAEGKEIIRGTANGDVTIDGNLKIPSKDISDKLLFLIGQKPIENGHNQKFKDRQRDIAKEESKLIKKIEKSQTELNKKSVYNPFYQISQDTLDLKKKIATDRLKELAIEKEKLGALQEIFQKIGDDLYIDHADLNKKENLTRVSKALDYIVGTGIPRKFQEGGSVKASKEKEEFVLSQEAAENIDKIGANRDKATQEAFKGPNIIVPNTRNRSIQIEDLVNPYTKNPEAELPDFLKKWQSEQSGSSGFSNGTGEFILPPELEKNEFAQEVYNELLTYSEVLSPVMMAGIMANIYQETGFNKKYLGSHGSKDHNGNTTSSQGLVGWLDARWNALKPKIEAKGYDPMTVKGQVFGIVDELTTLYPNTYKKMASSKSAQETGFHFMYEYEAPGEKDDPTHSGYKRRVDGATIFIKPFPQGTTATNGMLQFTGKKGEIFYVNPKRNYTQQDLDEITRHFGEIDESIIKLSPDYKPKLSELTPHMKKIATYLSRNYPGIVFTFFKQGKHTDGSAHYIGEAMDVGGNSSDKKAYENLRKDIPKLVGMGLNFIDETNTTDKKPHLHISLSSHKYESGGTIKRGWLDDITEEGYLEGSSTENRKMNIIPTNNITMKGVKKPIIGIDNKGNKKLMLPGFDYLFEGDFVREYPLAQSGKKIKEEGEPIEGYPGWRQGYDEDGNIVHFNPETGENRTYLQNVTVTGDKSKARKELTRQYYFDNLMPKFSKQLGNTPDNLGKEGEEGYQKYVNNILTREYLEANPFPENDADRLGWMQKLEESPSYDIIAGSDYAGILEPSGWQNFKNAAKKIGAEFANSQVPLEYRLKDPLQNVEPAAGTTKEELRDASRLGILYPLEVPGNYLRGAIGASKDPRLSYQGRPDGSDMYAQFALDPLNGLEVVTGLAAIPFLGKLGIVKKVLKPLEKLEDFENLTLAELKSGIHQFLPSAKDLGQHQELKGIISKIDEDLLKLKPTDKIDKSTAETLFDIYDPKVQEVKIYQDGARELDFTKLNEALGKLKKGASSFAKGTKSFAQGTAKKSGKAYNFSKRVANKIPFQEVIQYPIRPLTPFNRFRSSRKPPEGLFFPIPKFSEAKKLAGNEKLDIKDFGLKGYNKPKNKINWNPLRNKSMELHIPKEAVDKYKLVLKDGKLESVLDEAPILNKEDFDFRRRDLFSLTKGKIDKDVLKGKKHSGSALRIIGEGVVGGLALEKVYDLILANKKNSTEFERVEKDKE